MADPGNLVRPRPRPRGENFVATSTRYRRSRARESPDSAVRIPSLAMLCGVVFASGCWKDVYGEIPPDVLQFRPESGGPDGWQVSPIDVPGLQCPDSEPARFYVLYPQNVGADPMLAAVLYHSGSFDYVYAPEP